MFVLYTILYTTHVFSGQLRKATTFIFKERISTTCNKISDVFNSRNWNYKRRQQHATAHAATNDDPSCILINYPSGNPAPCLNIIKLLIKDLTCLREKRHSGNAEQ